MFENSNMWISGFAKEQLKNKSVCVYHEDKSLTNLKSRDELGTRVCVFVDASEKFNDKFKPI
jgi:hypothetical protein